jgi:hypothetical protein
MRNGFERHARGTVVVALLALSVASAPGAAASTNLLTNPEFDTNTSGWQGPWIPTDASGNPHSGAVRIVGSPGFGTYVSQCAPAAAGASYVAGGSAWIDSGLGAGDFAEVSLGFYASTDCTGSTLAFGGPALTSTTGSWTALALTAVAPALARSARVFLALNNSAASPGDLVVLFDHAFLREGACAPSPTRLCLNQGRFRVEATWTTADQKSGPGMAVPFAGDSGSFWFFDAANVEMDVKVLNACGLDHRYWLFAAGLTNVKVVLKVTDTKNGSTRMYDNPQGKVFQTITDTNAFATCP